jgi:hypothetical protein
VDGKTLRGARTGSGQVHLLAVMDHTSHAVLNQVLVEAKTNEITAFVPLLDSVDLRRTVVTSGRRRGQPDGRQPPLASAIAAGPAGRRAAREFSFDPVLRDLAAHADGATARTTATFTEYPAGHLRLAGAV